jgi:hypothetical protein
MDMVHILDDYGNKNENNSFIGAICGVKANPNLSNNIFMIYFSPKELGNKSFLVSNDMTF